MATTVCLDVGDDAAFHDPDAELAELGGEVLDIGVPGAAAQDLVADDQDAGGDGFGGWLRLEVSGISSSLAWPCYRGHRVPNKGHEQPPRHPDDSVDYWRRDERTIKLHGPEGFEGMRRAGRLAAETLDFITPHVVPGVTTGELDKLCHDFILDHKAIPAPLGYRGFPKSICTSINHVVCHGIPGDKRLQNGDIVNIDVTTILDGWYGDTSRMFFVGEVGVKARRLCDVTYEAMMRGIAAAKPGGHVGDIGHAIQTYVESQRFSVVRDFSGHGLGRIFHDAPNILHYGKRRHRAGAAARHVLHRRADGECRHLAGEGAERRLDGGDARQAALGPVRAFGRHHRDRRGVLHPLAAGLTKPPYDLSKVAAPEKQAASA